MYRTLEIDFVRLVTEFVQLREMASEKTLGDRYACRIRQLVTELGTLREVKGSSAGCLGTAV
jgi:hypothetical protein